MEIKRCLHFLMRIKLFIRVYKLYMYVVWIDRSLLEDEHLIVFKTVSCFHPLCYMYVHLYLGVALCKKINKNIPLHIVYLSMK
jgi:hypothetical protein